MNISTLNSFFEALSEDEMSLLYSGDFSDNVTAKVIELNGVQFDDGSDMNKLQRKTGFLIAECFQNIVRHNESSIENGYFLSRNDDGVLYIASGNIITNEMIDLLSDKLHHLNSLSKEELKEVYVKTLSNNTLSEKGGAGLGLIEMARKTGNKLDFNFTKISETLSYFYFQLIFDTNKIGEKKDNFNHTLENGIELRKKMLDDHIFLVYQGDVSMNTIMPILSMVEKSLAAQTSELMTHKKVFLVLIEFLQNMSKHGASINERQDGLLLIGEKDGHYFIGGSNRVYNKDKAHLEEMLEKYAHMELDSLNDAYKKVLKEGDPENEKGSSLGIIEMARRSSLPVEYEIRASDNGLSRFTMLLQI